LSIALRVTPLVFVAAVVQVAAISGIRIFGAEPDVLLVTVVVVGLVAGSLTGAGAGFAGGILFDSMTLGVLGTTSILLTLAGYWSGRYGETTGRGRSYAAPLAAFAISAAASIGGVALHFLLGQQVSAREALISLVPSAAVAALLALPIYRLCRAILAPALTYDRARPVELV
jgi:rod shape-determining protein MreD